MDDAEILQGVDLADDAGVIGQRIVEGRGGCRVVGVDAVAVVVHVGIELLAAEGLLLEIAEVAEVLVEAHLRGEADAHERHDADQDHRKLALVNAVGADAVDDAESLPVLAGVPFPEEMGQEDQGEHRTAKQPQRGEQAEVAEELRLGEHQAGEGADGRQYAEGNGRRLILQHLFRIADILEVRDDVQAVAERHAENDGADAHRQQRQAALDPVNTGQREERAVEHRQQLERNHLPVLETEGDEGQNDQQGDADRQQ